MAATAVFPSSPSRQSLKPSPNTPNAHPYAIKTTSTTLLSRSSSSAAQAANAIHRYVPPASPSPSPISPTSGINEIEDGDRRSDSQKSNGSMGMGRKGKHRYSRSLTDGPMPVPIPPGVTNNATRSYTGYSPSPKPSHVRERARSLASESGEEETPRRRPDGSRTSSSASSMGPPATPLHRYSSSDGTKTELGLPRHETGLDYLIANDSPSLKDGNFEFNSRRSLNKDELSGDEGEGEGELNGEGVTLRRRTARIRPRTRSRHSSMSSNSSASSSASGRVRDMVDELERSSSLNSIQAHGRLEEEGTASSRSSSPTKSSFFNTSRRVDTSPSKHSGGRALPQRPSVNDLFADKEVEAKETDDTITRVAKKNVKGREPRLLPFPPTVTGNISMNIPGGVLTPAHTGAGYPLPSSPEQQYLQQQYQGPADYELGFRHAASPHAQTFVVRHGHSPSNLPSPNAEGSGSANALGKPTRLLPYPPVTSETALHHPRPRRAVGVSDRDAEGGASTSQTSVNDEGAYVTAPESQESLSTSASSPLGGADEEGGEGEKSMAELLAAQSAPDDQRDQHGSRGVSGAEAWEIELGDTVKRVGEVYTNGAQPGSARNAKTNRVSSQKEIGRKAARAGTGGKGRGFGTNTGTGRDKDSLRRPGIMGLFDEVHAESPVGDVANVGAPTEPNNGVGDALEAITERDDRQMPLAKNEDAADERVSDADDRRRELEAMAEEVDRQSKAISETAKIVDQMREEISAKGREVEERAKDIEERLKRIEETESALDIRERSLVSREEVVSHKEKTVDEEVELKIQSKAADLDIKAQRLDDVEAALRVREEALEQRIRDVAAREEAVRSHEEGLAEREEALRKAQESLNTLGEQLDERENSLATAQLDLVARELRLQAKKTLGKEEKDALTAADGENTATTAGLTAVEQAEKRAVAEEQNTRHDDQPSGFVTNVLRQSWRTFVLPVVGENRTPAFLRTSTPPSGSSASASESKGTANSPKTNTLHNRRRTPTRAIRRDAFLGRFMGGPGELPHGYLVLIGIGMCVVVLRVLGRRGWAMRR